MQFEVSMDFLAQMLQIDYRRRSWAAAGVLLLAVVWLAAAPYCLAPETSSWRGPASMEESAEPVMEDVDALRPLNTIAEEELPAETVVLSIRHARDLAKFPLQEHWGVWRTIWLLAPFLFLIIGGGIFSLAAHTGFNEERRLVKPGVLQVLLVSFKFLLLASFLVTVIGGLALLIFVLLEQWWQQALLAMLVTVLIMLGLAVFGLRYLLAIWYIFCEEFKLGQALHPTAWKKFMAAMPPRFAWMWLKQWVVSTAEIFVVVLLASALLSAVLMILGAFGVGGLVASWAKYAQYIYLMCFGTYLFFFVGQAFYLGRGMRLLKEKTTAASSKTGPISWPSSDPA